MPDVLDDSAEVTVKVSEEMPIAWLLLLLAGGGLLAFLLLRQ